MQPVDVEGLGLHDYYDVKHFGSFFFLKLKKIFSFVLHYDFLIFVILSYICYLLGNVLKFNAGDWGNFFRRSRIWFLLIPPVSKSVHISVNFWIHFWQK